MGDFPGGVVDNNLPVHAGDMGSIPGPGRSHMTRNNQAHVPQLLSLFSIEPSSHQLWSPCATPTEACVP